MKRILSGLLVVGLAVALLAPLARHYGTVQVDLGQYPARRARRDEGAIAAARRLAAETRKNASARTFVVGWRTAVPPSDYASRLEYHRASGKLMVLGVADVGAAPVDAARWRTIYEYSQVTDARLRQLAADGVAVDMLPRYGGVRVS